MKMTHRAQALLAATVLAAGALCFAQSSGEATYKGKCQMCHGATGAAETPSAKMLKVKSVSDPSIKALTIAQMTESIKTGKARMPSFKDKLTDAQIKDVVAYYRGLK